MLDTKILLISIAMIFGIVGFVFGLISFIKLNSSKDNFQTSSPTRFCVPCSTTNADGTTFTDPDGTNVQCQNVGDWLNSDDGKQSLTSALNSLGATIKDNTFNINGNAKNSTPQFILDNHRCSSCLCPNGCDEGQGRAVSACKNNRTKFEQTYPKIVGHDCKDSTIIMDTIPYYANENNIWLNQGQGSTLYSNLSE